MSVRTHGPQPGWNRVSGCSQLHDAPLTCRNTPVSSQAVTVIDPRCRAFRVHDGSTARVVAARPIRGAGARVAVPVSRTLGVETLLEDPVEQTFSARRRPFALPASLADLDGPSASGLIDLPQHLDWSSRRSYDLDDPRDRRRVYEIVLREGTLDDL